MQDLSDKQRWRSKQGEADEQTAKATRVLTDRNDYPQNSNCDVVAYEVVITRSWDEKTERKKNKTKQKVLFQDTLSKVFMLERNTSVKRHDGNNLFAYYTGRESIRFHFGPLTFP